MNECIKAALAAKKISRAMAQQLDSYEDINQGLAEMTKEISAKRKEAVIDAVRIRDAWEKVSSHKGGAGDGLSALLARDMKESAGYNNIDKAAMTYEYRFHAKFAEAIAHFRTKAFGFHRDKAGQIKLARAIRGEATGDAEIDAFGKAWNELAEEIRQTKNKRGASISKNPDWHNPTKHDAEVIKRVGVDHWKKSIKDLLDRPKMVDQNGKVLDDAGLDKALDQVYESITTHGLNKTKDFQPGGMGTKLSKKGSEERFLYFKDADSFIKYNDEFGSGDFFGNLMGYINSNANDLALLEILGTNPDRSFQTLLTMAEKNGKLNGLKKTMLKATYNVVAGKTSGGDLTGIAAGLGAVRNVQAASTLGAAVLSAVSDLAFVGLTAKMNNIPIMKTMGSFIKNLRPGVPEDRLLAAQIGAGLDAFTGVVSTANRYGDLYGKKATARLAEGVLRLSGLNKWTDAGKTAFTLEFSGLLARNFNKTIDELDSGLKESFKRYGIDEALWNKFRKTKTIKSKNGAEFANLIEEGFENFHQMVMSERGFAVPDTDANTRAVTTLGAQDASIGGQAMKTVMNLKSFPITLMQTHLRRAINLGGTSGVAYAGSLLAITTLLGGLALQIKDVAAGLEPRPMGFDDKDPEQAKKFIAAAMLQGGGLGLLGDFLFSDVNRFGQGIAATLGGITGETADRFLRLTVGNVQELMNSDDTNLPTEVIETLKRYTPDTWQIRLLVDAMYDQIAIMLDPDYKHKLKKQMKKRKKEYGQGYWWKKGEALPGQ